MPQVWTRRGAGTAATPKQPTPLVRNPVPERPQIHLIELPLDWAPGSTQVYLIEGQPLTLIDTGVGTAASRAALEAALESLGYGLGDIERIVITHAHRDHFGLAHVMREGRPDLECCAHAADVGLIENYDTRLPQRIRATSPLFLAFGVPEPVVADLETARLSSMARDQEEAQATSIERVLQEGDRLEWKDWSLSVRHAPGHTPGHILLEDEKGGLLFTGDQIMGQAIPHAENFYLDGPPAPDDQLRRRPRFRGLVEMRKTLRSLRGRPFRMILPGYGGVVTRADRTIRDTLLHYEVRLQRIDRGLRRLAAMGQHVTVYEIWKALFPTDESPEETRTHLLLLIGALDCLEEDGQLVTERGADGVFTYHHR